MEITAPDQAKVGDVISVSCKATNSNPPADVTLIINGKTPSGTNSKQEDGINGGKTTITELAAYEVGPIDTDLAINCYVSNVVFPKTNHNSKIVTVLRKYK